MTDIETLLALLRQELHVKASVDRPIADRGESWIDLVLDGFKTTVAFRPGHGFGLFTSSMHFGEKPDEVYRSPQQACIRLCQLTAQWRAQSRTTPMSLRDLRQLSGQSQVDVSSTLGVTQAVISRLEARSDAKISTLCDYVAALGAKLELRAVSETFNAPLLLPHEASEGEAGRYPDIFPGSRAGTPDRHSADEAYDPSGDSAEVVHLALAAKASFRAPSTATEMRHLGQIYVNGQAQQLYADPSTRTYLVTRGPDFYSKVWLGGQEFELAPTEDGKFYQVNGLKPGDAPQVIATHSSVENSADAS